MTYWRTHLHPASPGDAVKHTLQSLAANYIGLDFADEVGDWVARKFRFHTALQLASRIG